MARRVGDEGGGGSHTGKDGLYSHSRDPQGVMTKTQRHLYTRHSSYSRGEVLILAVRKKKKKMEGEFILFYIYNYAFLLFL